MEIPIPWNQTKVAFHRLDGGSPVAPTLATPHLGLPRCKIFQPASKSNVGLAFMPLHGGDVNMANMTGASNKPYDYLACGLALLVSARPEWETMFVHPGYGLSCDPHDVDSIARCLRWYLEHPVEMREMGERGRQHIFTEWNYERQFAPVIEAMQS